MTYKIYQIIYIILAYITGSIPTAFIITKLKTGKDLRKFGSRNVGATNASRLLGKKWFFIISILDAFKGFIVVFIGKKLPFPEYIIIISSLMVILGHSKSIFLKFQGGKSVATSAGVFLAFDYKVMLILIIFFVIILIVFKYVSLASILTAILLPILMYTFHKLTPLFFFSLFISIFVIYKHRENIKRLIKGEELRWGKS